uniref:Uncharacterized protein n=1 Tax=Anguilla anguilla TaxID=7936 RepID=A0A0E9S000_ANGAN
MSHSFCQSCRCQGQDTNKTSPSYDSHPTSLPIVWTRDSNRREPKPHSCLA